MISVSIVGIGGQGSVLAAKILAQAAQAKQWKVRTAETIGMAQRGGNVASHVRIGNEGEDVYAPLPSDGSVDMLIALEPGEGVRSLHLLKEDGLLVTATSGVSAPAFNRKAPVYKPQEVVDQLLASPVNVTAVNDESLGRKMGNKKALNVVMLASAIHAAEQTGGFPITLDDVREAIKELVKPEFVEMNLKAIDLASEL